jgi:3',5'-cyclic AMP phosphodiesterase CpdA
MPTTVALRFRDLVGPPDSTIQRHKDLIASSSEKRVWWGWWSKPQEKVPFAVFAQFINAIKARKFRVFLVDSGQEKLYSAEIDEIFYSTADQPEPTPNPNLTPAYYKTEKYKAWFRFSSIEESKKEIIRVWSYDEVPDFTEDPTASRFNGKKVWNLAEMLNRRHRTIYFLREANPTDPDYLVELIPPAPPKDFLDTPIFCPTNCILHISDLHFGDQHAFPVVPDLHEQNLASTIKSSLERSGLARPSVIVVSGDLTWMGKSEEFEQARRMVSQLAVTWGLEPNNVLFCPGNHDMQWGPPESPYDPKAKVVSKLEEASKNYDTFFKNFYGVEANKWGAMARRYVLKNSTSVDLVAVNSSILEQENFRGYGLVTLPQMTEAFNSLTWNTSEDRSHFRVLVLHHHVVPVIAQDDPRTYEHNFSLTLDAAQIVHESGRTGVDLILHGHQHQPFLSFVEREKSRVLIIGAGSAGVKQEHIPAGSRNAFNVYLLSNLGLTAHTFERSQSTTGFEMSRAVRLQRSQDGRLQIVDQP